MKKTIRMMLAVAIGAGLYACATPFAGVASLRGTDAATPDVVPDSKAYAGKRPGSGQPIVRSFNEQPPLVPHAVDNFDEITIADNQCLECHSPLNYAKKSAPKVGDSHLAGGGGSAAADVRMDRYQCNSCHVPQVDARPLVQTTFVGTPVVPRKP